MDVREPSPTPQRPWWRVPAMWLVVGGPAAVVVAGLATAVIAVRGGDLPVREHGSRPSAESDAPAMQARNHVVSDVARAPR